jgi:sec-independent protein translocase protein TatA
MGAGLLQPTHIIFVIVIALLVFGPKRLPEMGRSIGHGIREFKDSIDGNSSPDSTEHHAEATTADAPAQPLRVSDLPPAGPPPATPPAAPAASAPATARSGSSVSR